jgi:hypothetical protein
MRRRRKKKRFTKSKRFIVVVLLFGVQGLTIRGGDHQGFGEIKSSNNV